MCHRERENKLFVVQTQKKCKSTHHLLCLTLSRLLYHTRGARACVQLYEDGSILDIYRQAREKLSKRPWRVDCYDRFSQFLANPHQRLRRVLVFVDNAGADVVLGMLPLARELLRGGAEVVLACNALPAINDVTSQEMRALLSGIGPQCPLLAAAYQKGLRNRATAVRAQVPPPETATSQNVSAGSPPALYVVSTGQGSPCLDLRCVVGLGLVSVSEQSSPCLTRLILSFAPIIFQTQNVRRVSRELADACQGVDLIVIEGMGRTLHTNLWTQFTCPSLKLAMVKNAHLAKKLFSGELYDCICLYESKTAAAAASTS